MSETPTSSESTNEAYATHAEGWNAAHEKDAEAAEKAAEDSGLESVEHELPEEAKFVANPEGLRKEEDSEEKFAEGQSDGKDTLETPGGETKAPAKKSAETKAPAKKG